MTRAPRRKELPVSEPETVASATEQTGLMPALPEDEAEAAAYQALYPVPRQRENNKSKRSRDFAPFL